MVSRYIYTYLVTIVTSCLFLGCVNNKTSALNDIKSFHDELYSNYADYTQEEWDIAQNQFGIICEELDHYEYTDEELRQIGKLKGQCTAIFAKHAASDFKNSIDRFGKEVEGFIDGFTEGLDNK